MRFSSLQPFTVTIWDFKIRCRPQQSEKIIAPLFFRALVQLYRWALVRQQMLPLIDRQNHRSFNPAPRNDLRTLFHCGVDHLAELCFCIA